MGKLTKVPGVKWLYRRDSATGEQFIVWREYQGETIWINLTLEERIASEPAAIKRAIEYAQDSGSGKRKPEDRKLTANKAFEKAQELRAEPGTKGYRPASTRRHYKQDWYKHVSPVFGKKLLHTVTRDDVLEVLRRMDVKPNGERYSRNSKASLHTCMSSTFSLCCAYPLELIRVNPARGLGAARPTRESRKGKLKPGQHTLSNLELEACAARCRAFKRDLGPRWETMLWLGVETGMRVSEVLGLTLDNVDWSTAEDVGVIHCVQQLNEQPIAGKPDEWLVPLKGEEETLGAKAREIPLSEKAEQVLRRYVSWASARGLVSLEPGAPLFLSNNLTVVAQQHAHRAFRIVFDDVVADRPVTFHFLRHTYASRLFEADEDIAEISNLLGHSSIRETRDTYLHFENRKARNRRVAGKGRSADPAVILKAV